MRLVDDARWVVRRAWSVRFIVIAALLCGAEVTIQVAIALGWQPHYLPAGLFAALAGLVSVAAFFARIVYQDKSS